MVVTNLSIAPGVFNINEPTMFGLPIVLNPIMFIPFILTPMVLVSVAYFATSRFSASSYRYASMGNSTNYWRCIGNKKVLQVVY